MLYKMPNEWSKHTFYAFAEFSTRITILARSIGTQGAPHGANLENASLGFYDDSRELLRC